MKLFFTFLFFLGLIGYSQDYVQNELLIQPSSKLNQQNFGRYIENEFSVSIESVKLISKPMNIYLVQFNDQINHSELLKKLKLDELILNAQNNHFVSEREIIPNDTEFNAQMWHLKNTGQTGGTVDADIDATEAWDISTGGVTTHDDTIVVCIIEGGGVDINHEDLAGNIWRNYAEIPDNDIDDDGNGYIDDFLGWNVSSNDDNVFASGSHGTRVAGMVGAVGNNNLGITGVNHKVKMMVVKGQQASNEASVIAAYSYPLEMRKLYNESFGEKGAFVVTTNASWGINNGDPADSPLWCAIYDSLGQIGIINIGATTNNNSNVDVNGDLPTTCPSKYLISVTMTNSDDVRGGSGYGPIHVDLAAPGQNVYLTSPNGFYNSTSGTSFATPCVAGSVGLLYSTPCPEFINIAKNYPDSAALLVRDYILDGVDPITNLSTEVGTGGRLNINNTMSSLNSNCNVSACLSPYHFRVENLTDTVVDIIWDGFSTDYILTIQEGNLTPVEITINNDSQLNIDTLKPCTNYTIFSKAVCGATTSEPSPIVKLRTDGCCENPKLFTTNENENSFTIEWNSVLYASKYDVRYRAIDDNDWITIADTNTPFLAQNLTVCTDYEFQIKTECTDSTRGFSDSYIFRTKGCGACYDFDYCEVIGADYSLEWLDTVIIGNVVSGTGNNNGWLVNEDVIFSFKAGETYNSTFIPGYASTQYTEKFSVWIDVNHNGIFESTEKLINQLTNNGPVAGLLIIPIDAQDGITKMRIAMAASASTAVIPCQTMSFYGEYEDYCVYIGDDASTDENDLEFSVYPNPSHSEINIKSNHQIDLIEIRSLDGKIVMQVANQNAPIQISELTNGIYFVTIYSENNQSTIKFVKQ